MPRPCSDVVIERENQTAMSWTRGCDSEAIHRLIRKELGSESFIPVRERNGKKVKLVIYNIDRAAKKTFMFVQIEVFYKAENYLSTPLEPDLLWAFQYTSSHQAQFLK